MQVVFVGEEAEDGGGPRREMWRLFASGLKGSYFEGNADAMVLRHDTMALQVKFIFWGIANFQFI